MQYNLISCCIFKEDRFKKIYNIDSTNSLGVNRYFSKVSSNFNLEISLVDMTNTDNLRKAIKSNTKVNFLSAPTCCVIVKYIEERLGLSHIFDF